MATNPVRYPNRLRECIKSSGYKMQEFAEETQIPLRTLHDYCSGKVPVPKKRLEIMAEMLGYPAEYLLPRMSISGIPSAASEEIQHLVGIPLEIDELDKSRRELLQQVPGLVSTALVTPSYALLDPALLDRLSSALAKPSTIDDATLNYLEIHTANYWGDRHGAVIASCDLLSYVSDLLQKVVMLLEGSLLPTVRMRLCSIASKIAQLVGELLLDMGYYSKARQFHEAAITAAQEGNNRALESIAWGRLSLAWIYGGNMRKAQSSVQEARHLAMWNNTMAKVWLAAIEAEVQANFGDISTCLKALDEAEQIEDQPHFMEDSYLVHFDRSLLGGYQGACFSKLYHPEDTQSIIYLEKAQNALINALALLDPALIQRQPTFLTDLASTYVEQGEIEEACRRAIQAVTFATQIKLQKVIRRLLSLRRKLEPWKDTRYVQALDSHLMPLLPPNT